MQGLVKIVRLLSLVSSLFLITGGTAYADGCEDQAQRAYDSALRECRNGGDECRRDADCSFGQECVSGQCRDADPVNCIPNCTSRWSDGSCREYGSDFCGRDPSCVSHCTSRWSDGSCREYSSDFCGEGSVSCTMNCTSRWSDGSCREYGADICN